MHQPPGGARPPSCTHTSTQPLHVARQIGRRAARRSEDKMARWQRRNLATTTRSRPLPLPLPRQRTTPAFLLAARPPSLLQTQQTQPIPARPGTSIVWPGIQAYRTGTSGTDLHFVRSKITTATGWWRVNKVTRRRNVNEAKSGPSWAWPRLVRSPRLPSCQVAEDTV